MDGVRNMMAAPAPGATLGRAVALNNAMLHVQHLVLEEDTRKDGTVASIVGYRSNLLEKTTHPACSCSKKRGNNRERSKLLDRCQEQTSENNPCKHCRKWKRRSRHPQVNEDWCFWDKTWKGFRPRYCCKDDGH